MINKCNIKGKITCVLNVSNSKILKVYIYVHMYDESRFFSIFFLFLSSSFFLSVYAHTNRKDGKKEQVKKGLFTFYVQQKVRQGRVIVESNDVFSLENNKP
jgi:hypothetical protein